MPKRYGRYFPQRVFVRSARIPMAGSLNASTALVIRNIVPTAAGARPKTSV